MGVSENRGPQYSTLNGRILVIRTPKTKVPLILRKPPYNPSGSQAGPNFEPCESFKGAKPGLAGPSCPKGSLIHPKPHTLEPQTLNLKP